MAQQQVLSECIHGLTYAWCSLCKEKTVGRVKNERDAASGWLQGSGSAETDPTLSSYPHTMAKYDGSCPGCGDEIEAHKDRIYLCDEEWICTECATDFVGAGAG